MLKKGDVVVIAVVLALAFSGMYYTGYASESSSKIIEVVHDGEVVASYKIDKHFDQTFDFFDGEGGHEVYRIHNGGVEVIESNTPQKICMKMGFIDRDGQMIVALPHKMYITVKSQTGKEDEQFDSIVK